MDSFVVPVGPQSSRSNTTPNITDFAKIRILVVGDSGTGKTSLVHKLCHSIPLSNPRWTVGCSLDMSLYEYTQRQRKFFIEFWDVGGHRKYKDSRHIFYSQMNAILLVFDLTNRNSYMNLRKWIRELVQVDKEKGIEEKYYHSDTLRGTGRQGSSLGNMPVLVIGNKKDQAHDRMYECMKDYGLESLYISSTDSTDDSKALSAFFNRVIERRHFRHTSHHVEKGTPSTQRRSQSSSSSIPVAISLGRARYSIGPHGLGNTVSVSPTPNSDILMKPTHRSTPSQKHKTKTKTPGMIRQLFSTITRSQSQPVLPE